MIKLVGCAFVVLACSLLGFYKAKEKEDRAKELSNVETSLAIVKNEIQFSLTPLPEAFLLAKQGNAGKIFEAAASFMRQGQTAAESYIKALDTVRLPFKKRDWQVLLAFGAGLSAPDKEGQLTNLALCEKRIGAAALEAARDRDKCVKIYRSCGVLFGLVLSILML